MVSELRTPVRAPGTSGARAVLNAKGICSLPDAYGPAEIAALNAAVEPVLRARADERRSYVHIDELLDLGLLDTVLGPRMRDILFAIMPDPVLYHCFVIETAGNDPKPNLFADRLSGWHRDADCSFSPSEPTHASVFVYLCDVGEDDGAFEFVPQNPTRRLRSSTPAILVTGPAGYTFAWQRSFFHRASPNRGPRRRRLVKISIQRNAFPSAHLTNAHFQRTLDAVPRGDQALDVLFGRYQGRAAPWVPSPPDDFAAEIASTGKLGLPDAALAKGQLRLAAVAAKARVQNLLGRSAQRVAYDD